MYNGAYGGDDVMDFDQEYPESRFADPGGNSSLHAETATDKRIHPCPSCDRPNRLTLRDKQKGYQCNTCANAAEWGIDSPAWY